MNPTCFSFNNPQREEWRLPDYQDPLTEEMKVIRHNGNEPAVISAKGYKAWYVNGLRHRINGPAIEFDDFKCWYEDGKCHRVDGPAVEFSDGTKQWWVNGVRTK